LGQNFYGLDERGGQDAVPRSLGLLGASITIQGFGVGLF
jgi:hypothetical protein